MQLSENTQAAKLQFLKRTNFSFFEDTENCPKITTLLPLNHRIDFRGNTEYYVQVAVKFSCIIFRRELSQIPPKYVLLFAKFP